MKAYSYLRISSTEQRKLGGIERQRANLAEFALRKGLDLDPTPFLDSGLSAMSSANAHCGELKRFLDQVRNGTIKAGSALILENMDRLCRDEPEVALSLVLGIVSSGIVIWSISPEAEYRAGGMDTMKLVSLITEQARASSEVKIKQKRSNDHWSLQRTGEVVNQGDGIIKRQGYSMPGWIKWEGVKGKLAKHEGRYVLDFERAKIVRRMFDLAANGYGSARIAHVLAQDGIECFGKGRKQGKVWYKSCVHDILTNRACIGEFQPCKLQKVKGLKKGKRVKIGDPQKIYPAVVTQELFDQVQLAKRRRHTKKGNGIHHKVNNLFSGKIKDASGRSYFSKNRNRRGYLVSVDAGNGSDQQCIPIIPFTKCVLEWISELNLEVASENPLPGLRARQVELEDQMMTMKSKMKSSARLASLLDVYDGMAAELDQIKSDIQEASIPKDAILHQVKLAIDYYRGNEEDESARRKLRHHLSILLSEIVVHSIDGEFRHCKKTFNLILRFVSGDERRVYFEWNGRTGAFQSGIWSEDRKFKGRDMAILAEHVVRSMSK